VKPIVVGFDGSDHSILALERAVAEAELRTAPLHVVHVVDVSPAILHLPGNIESEIVEATRESVWSKADEILAASAAETERIDLDGYAGDVLVDYCEEVGATLLVVGTRGRGRLAAGLLGSTSRVAVEHATCDVLVVRSRAKSSG
jgi:nucleotide-binding universal stress UspA family protein